MLEVINIGPYPPPYGGVSIHIKRLTEYLQKNNIPSMIIDTTKEDKKSSEKLLHIKSKVKLFNFLFWKEKSILHFHNFSLKHLVFMYLTGYKHKVFLSIHNEDFKYTYLQRNKLIYKLMTYLINKLDAVILDNQQFYDIFNAHVVKDILHCIPEYIHQENVIPLGDTSILNFIKSKQYIMSSNATRIVLFDGEDLYGIDLMVELFNRLVYDYKIDVGLVLVIPSIDNKEYFESILQRIKTYQLEDNILLFNHNLDNIISLWKNSDIVLRPTNTDGNSLTIMEALTEGTPVIASDCVERPKGTVIFKNRDISSFTEVTTEVINNLEKHKSKIKVNAVNNAEAFIKLYKKY